MRRALLLFVAGVVTALPSASMEIGRPLQRCMPAAAAPEDPSLEMRQDFEFSDEHFRHGCRGVWRFGYCPPIDNGLC